MNRLDLSDALIIAGLLLIAAGAGWIYRPLALLVPGVALFVAGVRVGRGQTAPTRQVEE